MPHINCTLRLTVIDALGGSHTLEDTKRIGKQSGNVAIPIEIVLGEEEPVNRLSPEEFNDQILSHIFEGTGLLAECEIITGAPPHEFEKKVRSWVLDVEKFLRDSRGARHVTLFQAEAGIPLPVSRFGQTPQAKLCHYIRSRLKNLKIISLPTTRLR